jgi:hypothetical protein
MGTTMSGPPDEDAEAHALERLVAASEAIVTGVEAALPGWVLLRVDRLLDAWSRSRPDGGSPVPSNRASAVEVRAAAEACATRVGDALRALFALDPSRQHTTPLEIVRTALREPTAVLGAAGVPEVARAPFDERAFPDDRYDLVPRTLSDLGDPELGPLLLEWGLAKAAALRARAAGPV